MKFLFFSQFVSSKLNMVDHLQLVLFILKVFVVVATSVDDENYFDAKLPAAPEFYDYRELNCVTKIKDQGPICDNCWAFR